MEDGWRLLAELMDPNSHIIPSWLFKQCSTCARGRPLYRWPSELRKGRCVGWPANQTHEHGGHAIALLTCQARIELRSQARTGCGILDTEPVRRTCSRAQRERIAPHSQEIYAHCLCCTAVRNTDCPARSLPAPQAWRLRASWEHKTTGWTTANSSAL